MRVDFLGRFQQVQKIVNAPSAKVADSAEFQQQLELSTPAPKVQVAEITEQKPNVEAISKSLNDPPRARMDFAKAVLLAPPPSPLEIPKAVSNPVKESAAGVKTPSNIEGRFIKLENPFQGLTRNERQEAVGKLVSQAGEEHGVDPALSLGVIKAESNFNPVAISSDGHESKGLMQLLDSTGQDMMARLGVDEKYTPFDPEQNIDLGVGYLRRLHDLFGASSELGGNLRTVGAANSASREKLAVAAYNAGEGRVATAQQRAVRAGKDAGVYENVERYLPEITREYVKRVMSNRSVISSENKG